jgi:hypothetical protein
MHVHISMPGVKSLRSRFSSRSAEARRNAMAARAGPGWGSHLRGRLGFACAIVAAQRLADGVDHHLRHSPLLVHRRHSLPAW